jgi:hypothetical protein
MEGDPQTKNCFHLRGRTKKAELSSFKHSGEWANLIEDYSKFPFSNEKSFSDRVFSLFLIKESIGAYSI